MYLFPRDYLEEDLRPHDALVIVDADCVDVEHLAPEDLLRRADVADAREQLVEVVPAASALEPLAHPMRSIPLREPHRDASEAWTTPRRRWRGRRKGSEHAAVAQIPPILCPLHEVEQFQRTHRRHDLITFLSNHSCARASHGIVRAPRDAAPHPSTPPRRKRRRAAGWREGPPPAAET